MNQKFIKSKDWYQAIPLRERITSLPMKNSRNNFDLNIAQCRMKQIQSQSPFNHSSWFEQRLKIDGLDEDDLLYLLGESLDFLKKRLNDSPEWLNSLEATFLKSKTESDICEKYLEQQEKIYGFLYFISPLLERAYEELEQKLNELVIMNLRFAVPFDLKSVVPILFTSLLRRLLGISLRTMVLELNISRLQGDLNEDTPSSRFQCFVERLKQKNIVLPILQEYSVLARQLIIYINQWLNFSLEFVVDLCTDWEELCLLFSPEQTPGIIVELKIGTGDYHRQGRSVIVAQFESGLKLVYKPRNLAVDQHFQELLTWLNKREDYFQFKTLKVLNKNSHGWVEFVESKSCQNKEEIERFYQRQGGYLALLHTLEAADFHNENLIASGEHPMLIDLEALFHFDRDESVLTKAYNQMIHSVLKVGLLPQKLWSNEESEGIDVSGLGGLPGQLTPFHIPTWENMGTDEMRLTLKQMEIPVEQNIPILNESYVNAVDYTEFIVEGFTRMYKLLVQFREELLSQNGFLKCFENDEVRVILRPTDTYAKMLWESYHPDFLRNALDRDRFFDRLWIEVQDYPELAKVVVAEQHDLWQGDIPIFTTYPNSCNLWTSTNQQVCNFFSESGLSAVYKHLQRLGEHDLEHQIWLIRASLATLVMGDEEPRRQLKKQFRSQMSISTGVTNTSHLTTLSDRLIFHSCLIADRLETLAIRGNVDATWLGLTLVDERQYAVLPLEADLYDGLSGIILFLAYLAMFTNENRYKVLAKAALESLQVYIQQPSSLTNSIGAFSGLGGIVYLLTHLGVLWNEPKLLVDAEELIEFLHPLIAIDEEFDIMGGAAGCIGSLLSLYCCNPSQRILDTAIQCGNHLISQAQTMKRGVGWTLKELGTKPLSGFSHGAAGISWALLKLYALTNEKRFYQTALDAIAYERSLFYPQLGNWLDLRLESNTIQSSKHICETAWCHGAPGIGLARLHCLPYLDNLACRAEINTAIKTTLEKGFGCYNQSLCHGDLGNLELIIQTSFILDDSYLKTQVDRLAASILDSIETHGWLCGVPLGVETPGLMTGLAGIGYGLLRLAAPALVPSVLILEPPKSSQNH